MVTTTSKIQRSMKASLLAAVAGTALSFAVLPAGPVEAARPVSEKSLSHMDAGRKHIDKRNWNAAVIELKNALQADPNNVDARLMLGEVYIKQRNGVAAEKEFNAAIDRGAKKQDVVLRMADAYLLQRKFQEALDLVKIAGLPKERRYEGYLLHGTAYLGLRQTEEAVKAYSEAEKLNPTDSGAKIGLSRLAIINRDFDTATSKVDAALKADPRNIEALLIKGELARLKNDFKQSFVNFDAAVGIEADNMGALLGRAASLVELQRFDEAKRDLDLIFKRIPNHPMAHYLAARIAWQNRDLAKASEHLQATGGALDNFPPAVFLNGVVNYANNNLEQAAFHLSRLVEVAPDHVQARRLLAMTLLRQGDPKQAVSTLQPIIDSNKADAQINSVMGYALMQSGELDKASDFFDKAVQADPETSGNWTRLAVSKLALGDTEEAEGDLEKVLAKDPKALQPAIILTMLHLREGRSAKALDMIKKIKANHPENPVGSYLEGEVYLKDNKTAEARRAFEAAQKINDKNFAPSLKLAQIDVSEGKLDAAEKRYTSLLAKNKKHVPSLVGLADLDIRRGNVPKAVTWLEQAADADANNMNVRLQLISLHMDQRQMEKAEAVANRLTQRFSNEPVAYEALGKVQMARGDIPNALASYERMVALRPEVSTSHQLLANAELANKNTGNAIRSLETGLGYAPAGADFERELPQLGSAASILSQLAEIETKEKKFKSALARADEIAKRYPKSPAGEITKANILLEKGDFGPALKVYESMAAANKGGAQVAINRYRAEKGLGDGAKALANLSAWVDKNPKEAVARNVLASAYIEANQTDKAIGQYEILHKAAPKDPLILNNLAWLYSQKKDPKAETLAAEAHKLAPQSPEILDTYAWILVQKGAVDKGLDLLKKAVVMRPGSPEIRYHLAVALSKAGQAAEARRELQDLMALGVSFSEEKEARALLGTLTKK